MVLLKSGNNSNAIKGSLRKTKEGEGTWQGLQTQNEK